MGSALGGMGGKGGSTSQASMPKWYEDMAQQQAQAAQAVGQLPYMPWMMPDVAAAPPQLQNAWDMSNQWGNAFGMTGMGGMGGGGGYVPQQGVYQVAPGAQPVPGANPMFGGGHASWPAVNQNLQMLEQYYPGIMDAYYNVQPDAARPIEYDPATGQPVPGTIGSPRQEEKQDDPARDKDFADYMEMRMQGWGGSGGMDPVAGNYNARKAKRWNELNERFGG